MRLLTLTVWCIFPTVIQAILVSVIQVCMYSQQIQACQWGKSKFPAVLYKKKKKMGSAPFTFQPISTLLTLSPAFPNMVVAPFSPIVASEATVIKKMVVAPG